MVLESPGKVLEFFVIKSVGTLCRALHFVSEVTTAELIVEVLHI